MTYGLQPARVFCSWESPGKNTEMSCRALEIFPTQGLNPSILHTPVSQENSLPIERPDKPFSMVAAAAAAKSLQSCPTLCDLIDGSPPGSPVPGILQARTLEWVAISFSNA